MKLLQHCLVLQKQLSAKN